MRLLALPLLAAVASTGWALRESRVPSELTGPAFARVSPASIAVAPPAAPSNVVPAAAGPAPASLPLVAMVRGRVVEDGEPVADHELHFLGTTLDSKINVTTDGEGRFEVVLVADDYDLEGDGVETRVALAPGQILDGLVLSLESSDEEEDDEEDEEEDGEGVADAEDEETTEEDQPETMTVRLVAGVRICSVTCEEKCDVKE